MVLGTPNIRFTVPIVGFEIATLLLTSVGHYLDGTIYTLPQLWRTLCIICLAIQIITTIVLICSCVFNYNNPRVLFVYGPYSVARASIITAVAISWFRHMNKPYLFYKPAILVITVVYWLICVWLTIIWVLEYRQERQKIDNAAARRSRFRAQAREGISRARNTIVESNNSHHVRTETIDSGHAKHHHHQHHHLQDSRRKEVRPIKIISTQDGAFRYGALSRFKAQSKVLLCNVARAFNPQYGNSHHSATVAMNEHRSGRTGGQRPQSFVDPETGQRVVLAKVVLPPANSADEEPCRESCCLPPSYDSALRVDSLGHRDQQRRREPVHRSHNAYENEGYM